MVNRWHGSIEVEVVSVPCGDDNASYYPGEDLVVLCSDTFNRPAMTRWMLNHELGHAFMDQHQVPNDDPEVAADELAFLMSTPEESWAMVQGFLKHPYKAQKGDPHPGSLDRAGSLICLLEAEEEDTAPLVCRVYYRSLTDNWMRIIGLLNEEP